MPGANLFKAMASYEGHGAGTILQHNGIRAAQLIEEKIALSLRKHSTYARLKDDREVYLMIRAGDTDEVDRVGRLYGRVIGAVGSQIVLTSTALHETFTKLLPADVICFNKALSEVFVAEDGLPTIYFSDGSKAKHSIVVGCDGLHSKIQPYVLDTNTEQPRWIGKYIHRCFLPMKIATTLLGQETADQSSIFVQAHQHTTKFPVDNHTRMSLSHCGSSEWWKSKRWAVQTDRAEMRNVADTWSPKLKELLLAVEPAKKWALFDLPHCNTYANGRLVVMEDAAHASNPFLGASTSMAVEDALIPSTLIGLVEHEHEIEPALQAYDAVRRPRTQNVVMRSRDVCKILHLEHPELGIDLNKVARAVEASSDWFSRFDLDQHLRAAKQQMRQRTPASMACPDKLLHWTCHAHTEDEEVFPIDPLS